MPKIKELIHKNKNKNDKHLVTLLNLIQELSYIEGRSSTVPYGTSTFC
jgi:hypothetical protein